MRFLRDVNFDVDDKGMALAAKRIEDFLRVGSFTHMEWDSLTAVEQALAVTIKKSLKLEEALNLRAALQANSLESAAEVLRSGGDDHAADHIILQDAVERLAKGMNSVDFAGANRE
jgi:hypothetical protein